MGHALPKPNSPVITSNRPSDLDAYIQRAVLPALAKIERGQPDKNDTPSGLKVPTLLGFVMFITAFAALKFALPNTGLEETLSFIAFPVLFILSIIITAFLFRERISDFILRGRDRFLIRNEILSGLAAQFNLEYVPVPGGPSSHLKALANWRYCPEGIKVACAAMEDHGGFDDVSAIIRESGLAVPREFVIASEKNREKYYAQQLKNQQFEDGFKGTRKGISFAALEWSETSGDTTVHHLLIALKLPIQLTGAVEFKNKAAKWPAPAPKSSSRSFRKKVGLVSRQFSKAYSVRSNDQVEARLIFDPLVIENLTQFAASGPVCGVAFEDNLVVGLSGHNHFDIVDLMTGEWSHETIEKTLTDFTNLLDFVDSVAHAFAIKADQ